MFIGRTDAEADANLQSFGHLMRRTDSLEKTLILGKIEGKEEEETTEDEMVGWHHQFNGHEFEQALGDGEGQGGLVCCSPWGYKESDTTEWLNNNKLEGYRFPGSQQWYYSMIFFVLRSRPKEYPLFMTYCSLGRGKRARAGGNTQ